MGSAPFAVCVRFSIALVTRMTSPSRSPSRRIVSGEISARMESSILSRLKADEYRVQSSMSQPADKKKSNQSKVGRLGGGAGRALLVGLDTVGGFFDDVRMPRGTLSSSTDPCFFFVTWSTYARSSGDIFSAGTSIMTPFILWSRNLPLLVPKNSASTLNCPLRSCHMRVRFGTDKSR